MFVITIITQYKLDNCLVSTLGLSLFPEGFYYYTLHFRLLSYYLDFSQMGLNILQYEVQYNTFQGNAGNIEKLISGYFSLIS